MRAYDGFPGVALVEPDADNLRKRGKFRMEVAYCAKGGAPASPRREASWRLMDLCLAIAASGDDEYFTNAAEGEFAVVDVVTKEKAWFELPFGATPHNVAAMVESHFNASAFRVGEKLWFV